MRVINYAVFSRWGWVRYGNTNRMFLCVKYWTIKLKEPADCFRDILDWWSSLRDIYWSSRRWVDSFGIRSCSSVQRISEVFQVCENHQTPAQVSISTHFLGNTLLSVGIHSAFRTTGKFWWLQRAQNARLSSTLLTLFICMVWFVYGVTPPRTTGDSWQKHYKQ